MKLEKIFISSVVALCVAAAHAQGPGEPPQGGPPQGGPGRGGPGGPGGQMRRPSAEDELKRMTEHLKLSKDQQKKIKPILEATHKQGKAIFENKKLDWDEKREKMHKIRDAADKKIRALLNAEQKKKFDNRPRPGGPGGPGGPPPGGPGGPPPPDFEPPRY